MRVKINRDVCPAHLAFCEQCLGKFLREPLGYERRCFEEIVDDESDILTIEMHSDNYDIVLRLNDEERRLAAGEGWSYFVDFDPSMYR
ncbi:MAG: hypothetical protein GYB66_11630 [Chloroflexi bacterium]|nr:hypothetical protein [Chloroflexota bacterium]